jgi:hypothetical protein
MVNRWVAHHYPPDAIEPARQKNTQIVITSKLPDMGSISITDPETAVGLKMWHSLKKMTWDYLDQHDDNVTAMSRKFVDKLVAEL